MAPTFASPPNLHAFHAQVWDVVHQIPPGKVTTYGQIAKMIPPPEGVDAKSYLAFGPRWVGGAMAACPPDVPWQRVINAQGKISLRAGAEEQRRLLEAEGVEFDERERIDLHLFGWPGPSAEWQQPHGLLVVPKNEEQPLQF
jgi:methylated-DNA-protein-cysteine methyltransferase-like protein